MSETNETNEINEILENFTERVDERDVIFCRMGLKEGTPEYEYYYNKHPEKLVYDTKARSKPLKGGESAKLYNPLATNLFESNFGVQGLIKKGAPRRINPVKTQATPEQFSKILIGLAKFYGAKKVGILKLEDRHLYSNKGKAPYGEELTTTHTYGITFCIDMPEDYIATVPHQPAQIAVTKGYLDLALIGRVIEYCIREYGYDSHDHIGGPSCYPLVKVCEDSFIGETGKHGLVITKEYGPRVRIGLVTTDLELVETPKERHYIREFCELCGRCQSNCPGRAIQNTRSEYRSNQCFSMWQHFGTDCGVCIDSCPFSHNLPAELIDDLSTPEARERLAEYCEEHFPRVKRSLEANIDDFPDWIRCMYE